MPDKNYKKVSQRKTDFKKASKLKTVDESSSGSSDCNNFCFTSMQKNYTKEAETIICFIRIPKGIIVNKLKNGRECDAYIEGNNRAVKLFKAVVVNLLKKIDGLNSKGEKTCTALGNALMEIKKLKGNDE